MYFEVDHSGQRADLAKSVHHCLGVPQSPSQSGRAGREKGTSLNSTCLTPKPLAPSVYVHVLEVPSPQERSISVMSLFPYPSDLPTDSARAAVRLASSSLSLPCWLAHRSSKLHRLANHWSGGVNATVALAERAPRAPSTGNPAGLLAAARDATSSAILSKYDAQKDRRRPLPSANPAF